MQCMNRRKIEKCGCVQSNQEDQRRRREKQCGEPPIDKEEQEDHWRE